MPGAQRPGQHLSDLGNLNDGNPLIPASKGKGLSLEVAHWKGNTQTEPHEILDACGGAAVSCFGNGWVDDAPELHELRELLKRMQAKKSSFSEYGQVALALTQQVINGSYFMHYAYTSDAHQKLTDLLVVNANIPAAVLKKEEKMLKVMVLNSGSEVCDAMVKLTWQYWNGRKKIAEAKGKAGEIPGVVEEKACFITRTSSYHGNTVQALSLSHFPARQENFGGLLSTDNLHKVNRYYPYRDRKMVKRGGVDAPETDDEYDDRLVRELVETIRHVEQKKHKKVAAFVIETVSGAVKKVCRMYDILLVYDEIMCGLGRIGYANAWHYFDGEFRKQSKVHDRVNPSADWGAPLPDITNLAPDIMIVGKTLGAGIQPASAILANAKVVDAIRHFDRDLREFSHGHAYQAHAAVCAAAAAVQEIMPQKLDNVRKRGEQLRNGLQGIMKASPYIGDVRGQGLFWGVELVRDKQRKEPFHAKYFVLTEFVKHCRVPDERNLKVPGLDIYPGSWTKTEDAQHYTHGDHVIFAPAYVSTEQHIDAVLKSFKGMLEGYFKGKSFPATPATSYGAN
ncbi:aminotransferase [Apiospora rasikravindrae]|uniref:Aminotransferase n=1 Tax=Apiospora rasikravindrae TaxID=990691 RepID=A0ABR1SZW1_9PEZI